jgi:chromosome segregation protein
VFLKRIVLHGFKSFADRTEFDFGAGITGIVGPNGCGKSNVVDAVRWVLGEQSARSLRGDRMADVIFAGSRSRKPANFAEVQLTFDNRAGLLRSDQEEVVVGRVLYRSGESDYRLNGNSCRLRDTRELLLDTGVGVDVYSVIEQGRVDMLLQANPLERRELFEEAAGISRYKFRRVEAQRKLERTRDNLLRLQDLLDELEKRLRSVRLAAGKARNWQQYDARLRELRSAFSMAEYHELEQGRVQTQTQAEALSTNLQEARAQLAGRDAEVAELEHERQRLDEQIQAGEAALLEAQTALSALGERIALGEKRRSELAALRDRRRSQAADVLARLGTLHERMEAEATALLDLAAVEQRSAARIADVQTARQAAEQQLEATRSTLEREKVAAFEAVRRAALLQNERENRTQQQARLGMQAERLAARRQDIQREDEAAAGQASQLDARLTQLDQDVAALSAELRKDEERLTALVDQAETLDAQIGAAKEARTAATSRLTLLEDLEQRLEGVDQGTRAVLAWRDEPAQENVVVGLVADLLRIDDPRLPILQSVLSTFENYVVVRDGAAFVAELARRTPLIGPLRVLALDRLVRPVTPISYAHAPGFIARASDWVQCDPKFQPLAEHLLGRTFVVETIDVALRLASEALAGCVFVTLDGATVGADGRLTFGAATAAPGLISRKAEIRQLRGEIEEVEGRLVQLTRQRLEVDGQVSDVQLHKQGLLERIATRQREHAELRNERARVADARQRLAREAALVDEERAAVQRSLAELGEQLHALAAESEAIGAAQQTHEAGVTTLVNTIAEREAAVVRLTQEHTAALVERGRAAEKRAAAEKALEELRAQEAALGREQADAEHEAEDAVREIQAAESDLQTARQEQTVREEECVRCRTRTLEVRQQRQELLQRLETCGTAGRELQRRIEELEATWHEQQVALRESEVRKESLGARVRDELGLDLAALYQSYAHAEQDWEAIKAEIEELRGKIARLGNVNLDAIAELDELAPRYEHLAAQRADLLAAIERLEALIVELDQESRMRFAVAFEQIRANFQEMFRKLFGGGKADVVLEDPEQPLECGIEIIARPPGKEPQALSLLSGGEKTLTTVALLMGVFKSRPSPFTILDEVDAALDESNVGRFNDVLQEFLSHCQFVVITHSKRTMACADVLYGVTMEEPGVSKCVSVRFAERVETPIVA